MSVSERAHLFILARGEVPLSPEPAAEGTTPELWQILDSLNPYPAYITNARWDAVAWNEAARNVFVDFAALPPDQRNMITFLFTDPLMRERYADWANVAQNTLAIFRASTSRTVGDEWFTSLLETLRLASPEFDAM